MGVKESLSKLLPAPLREANASGSRERAGRAGQTLAGPWEHEIGAGQSWTPMSYGEYYPRSALVYAAIRARQDAVARVPLKVYRRPHGGRGRMEPAGEDHPAQRLVDSPNPFWTSSGLWRATETYLGLWGSAFWGLERDGSGRVSEIWPLRPDRMKVVPDPKAYVRGFVYHAGRGRPFVSYVPEDIVWMRYFNPLDEYAGLSPIAPIRLSADMALDALRAGRNSLANDSVPGLFIETSDTPTDEEARDFYERWESRFRGPDKVRRPALLSNGMKAVNMGFSPREMEHVQSLRWSLEDVSRAYGVPKPILGDLEHGTFANFATARRVFWEDTIVPQLTMYQDTLNRRLVSSLGDTSLHMEFDLGAVEALRESENDKARRRQTYVNAGIMTVDEVRAEMGMGPLRKGGMDGEDEQG